MRVIFSIVLSIYACSAVAGTNGTMVTEIDVQEARHTAIAPGARPGTITEYSPRFISLFLPNETYLIVDTAKGIAYTARQSRSTLNVWRRYNLTTVAQELNKDTLIATDSPVLATSIVHGRYSVRHRGDILFFMDTLTGRTWGARHREGVLDTWKCYDLRGE
jgi:hypothetical protein